LYSGNRLHGVIRKKLVAIDVKRVVSASTVMIPA
jgi:hypothetical protein